jgi:hypothetical protein
MKNLFYRGLLLLGLYHGIAAFAGAEQQEIDQYINILNTASWKEQEAVCSELQWSGISDTRLYDVIEAKLLGLLPSAAADKKSLDIVSWYSRALGTSGQDKYLGTLQQVASAPHIKLKRYGQVGVELLADYKKWNPIISNTKNHRADKSLRINRFLNMLQSDEWGLKRIATKRINYENISDPDVLAALNTEILQNYMAVTGDDIDTMEWMIRTLAEVGAPRYLETMQQISRKPPNKPMGRYTSKIIRKHY